LHFARSNLTQEKIASPPRDKSGGSQRLYNSTLSCRSG